MSDPANEALKLECPLCHQPVSLSLYQQITGIWKERSKLLSKIRLEETALKKNKERFEAKKTQLIQKAVERETKRVSDQRLRLQTQNEKLKQQAKANNDKIKQQSKLKIERLRASSESKSKRLAEKLAARKTREQTRLMKRELQQNMRDKMKDEKQRLVERERTKHETLNNTFRSTLQQLKTQSKEQSKELKHRAERIEELEKQLVKKTTPQIEGLLYESNLLAELQKSFPEDKFDHTGKGGDVIQHVFCKDQQVGVMVFECKRVQHFSSAHVTQALAAKEKRKGDFAILVTNAMRKGTQGFFSERGIMIVHATGVMSLATILRSQIVRISEMKLSQLERDSAVKMTMDFLQGPEFKNSMESITGETMKMHQELIDDIKKHVSSWKKQYSSLAKIHSEAILVEQTTKAMLTGGQDYKKLILKSPFPALVELPVVENPKS